MSNQYDFNNINNKPPPTGYKGTGMSRAGRLGTSSQGGIARPITSNKGAGFGMTNKFGSTAERFTTANKKKQEEQPMDPELRIKKYELEINTLVDESAVLNEEGDQRNALQKAKDASSKQKSLERFLDQNDLNEMLNTELFFCVSLNLACMYEQNELYQEAI